MFENKNSISKKKHSIIDTFAGGFTNNNKKNKITISHEFVPPIKFKE
jgi:hypothetical protein